MKLSVITLTKNSNSRIVACLKNAQGFADEHLIIDDNSKDETVALAKKFTSKIFTHPLTSFAAQRQWAAGKATGDWIFFLDSDERLTQKSWKKLRNFLTNTTHSAIGFNRLNYFFGHKMKHGGYWPDKQIRVFKKSDFLGVEGLVHEHFNYQGSLDIFPDPLIHLADRSVVTGLYKSAKWTRLEAKAFAVAHHPPVTWWRLIKVMIWEFNFRYFKKLGILDGYIGLVEAITQAANRFFVYQQLWELQQQAKLDEQYSKLEKSLL